MAERVAHDAGVAVVADFLVRAAREFRRGGWVFTGFHWPVLAGQLAHRLEGEPFAQLFEAGAVTHGPAEAVPTSTTDYPSYAGVLGFRGSTADVLLGLARRIDRVVLDTGNVDVRGRANSSFIGPAGRPDVRLPGGGGAPDIAARARELVWLNGASGLDRVHRRVEHVTAAPGPGGLVRMHTRWGTVRLGDAPQVEEVADVPGTATFLDHLARLGVDTHDPGDRPVTSAAERAAAVELLEEAAGRGYQVARRALGGAAR